MICCFGGRPSRSGSSTEQPFSHLRSSPFWRLHTQKSYDSGHTVLISDLMDSASYGAFDPSPFRLLRDSDIARAQVINTILNEWWPETLHPDIRKEEWRWTGW